MSKNYEKNRMFLYWILGNLVGWAFISALFTKLPDAGFISGFFVALLVFGVPFGLAQWLVLRLFLPVSPLWVVTIPISWFLFYFIAYLIPDSLWQNVDDEAASTLTVGFLVLGAMMGLSQWLILRRKLTRAALWILGSSLGVGLGFGIVLATGLINQYESISYIVVVLVYSITTGSLLSWLLNHKAQIYDHQFNAT
jgi:hypothetical protein